MLSFILGMPLGSVLLIIGIFFFFGGAIGSLIGKCFEALFNKVFHK